MKYHDKRNYILMRCAASAAIDALLCVICIPFITLSPSVYSGFYSGLQDPCLTLKPPQPLNEQITTTQSNHLHNSHNSHSSPNLAMREWGSWEERFDRFRAHLVAFAIHGATDFACMPLLLLALLSPVRCGTMVRNIRALGSDNTTATATATDTTATATTASNTASTTANATVTTANATTAEETASSRQNAQTPGLRTPPVPKVGEIEYGYCWELRKVAFNLGALALVDMLVSVFRFFWICCF
jgi:hypothetical protein